MNISEDQSCDERIAVSTGRNAGVGEAAHAGGTYHYRCMRVLDEHKEEALRLQDMMRQFGGLKWWNLVGITRFLLAGFPTYRSLEREFQGLPRYEVWAAESQNVVTTEGGNYFLDKLLAGSSYTAAWYVGLVNTSTAVAITNTYAAKGNTESTAYSNATRVAASFAAASAKSKVAASNVFNINATDTITGVFLANVSTKGDSTANAGVNVLYSISLLGTSKAVANTDTLTISYTASV